MAGERQGENAAMRECRPQVVFHAEGCEPAPMAGRQVFAAAEVNPFGTLQIALAAFTLRVE